MKQFLQILIRHLNENMDCYRKIYEANKDGELMGILRNGLLLIFTKKLEDAEKDGIKAKIAYPILSCLLTDFFFSVIKCYLELSGQFDTDVFYRKHLPFCRTRLFYRISGLPGQAVQSISYSKRFSAPSP